MALSDFVTAEQRNASPVYEDDRNGEQLLTHTILVGGRDSFMSGWGQAPNGSYAYWACRPEDEAQVTHWVKGRGDIDMRKRPTPRLKRGQHSHIYVVGTGHPALGGE